MPDAPFPILYEDNHLLVVSKPANLPTMGVAHDRDSLITLAKQYIKRKYNKPGNVYLGIVSRLDAPVTGAIVIARTSKAASRLTEQIRTRQISKTYWALVERPPKDPEGSLTDWVVKDERHRKMHIADADTLGAKEAVLRYKTLSHSPAGTLLEVELITGRKHQIRLQFATRGCPIVGDRKYGSHRPFGAGIALHSRRVAFMHPVKSEPIVLEAPLPKVWPGSTSLGI